MPAQTHIKPSRLPESESVKAGKGILAGEHIALPELLTLVRNLKEESAFGLARQLLDRHAEGEVRQHVDTRQRLRFAQQRCLCTYKDTELSAEQRLDRAQEILEEADPLARSKDQETLGLAGAIYKRKWELDVAVPNLEKSLSFYLRGYHEGVARDDGYTAINAAFILDLLAEAREAGDTVPGPSSELAISRRKQAREIRERIAKELPEQLPWNDFEPARKWSFFVTVGESYFGLEEFEEASKWLKMAAALPAIADWQIESTARQLSTLLRAQQKAWWAKPPAMEIVELSGKEAAAKEVLREFLRGGGAAVDSVMLGKVGLALSGGGFRASLYHIGVLARLAELDLLRRVEYLSCVSGGSIIGAHYYLEVRNLLQTKADADITQQDYLKIVEKVARDFLAGVQTNIRTRIAAEWTTNFKLIFGPNYTRTVRVGDLYESKIYSRVTGRKSHENELWIDELRTRPKDDPEFVPKANNWRRSNKVPILVLNATTLNTGHNWQFTTTWMGEPPAGADAKIDANYRLRRMYYDEAPAGHGKVRFGQAVAASACVPGLFEPLSLSGIYDDDGKPITVRLVDGGVHDNQGVSALLEQDCNVLLVSDASGQMDAQDNPSSGLLGVPLRSNAILQTRVRGAQYQELRVRRRSGLLRGLMFIHLKKDLGAKSVDWVDCQNPSAPARINPLLPYGIQREVQRRLAAIRTDLDSFTEVEAYSLMTSGYLMTKQALDSAALGSPIPAFAPHQWEFLKIAPLMKESPGKDSELMRQLQVGEQLAFKIWHLSRILLVVTLVLGLGLLVALCWLAWACWSKTILMLTVGNLLLPLICLAAGALGAGAVLRLIQYRKTFRSILVGIGMCTAGWLVARLHLCVFDKLFLRQGKLDGLLPKTPPRPMPPGQT